MTTRTDPPLCGYAAAVVPTQTDCARAGCILCRGELDERGDDSWMETDAILADPEAMAAIVEATAETGPVPPELAQAADDAWDTGAPMPSPAADLLGQMIDAVTDEEVGDRLDGLTFSSVDEAPEGAYAQAHDMLGHAFLVAVLPFPAIRPEGK